MIKDGTKMNPIEIAKACKAINEMTKELAILTVALEIESGESCAFLVIDNFEKEVMAARTETKT